VAIRSTRRLQLDHVLPLSQAAAAHRLVEERKSTGKVVLLLWGSDRSLVPF
jgi:NADPH:quinone reductase-like Zn-dependent oxidoreductase